MSFPFCSFLAITCVAMSVTRPLHPGISPVRMGSVWRRRLAMWIRIKIVMELSITRSAASRSPEDQLTVTLGQITRLVHILPASPRRGRSATAGAPRSAKAGAVPARRGPRRPPHGLADRLVTLRGHCDHVTAATPDLLDVRETFSYWLFRWPRRRPASLRRSRRWDRASSPPRPSVWM